MRSQGSSPANSSHGVRSRIEAILDVEIDRLLVKANTEEGLSLNDTKKLDLLIKAHQSFQLPDEAVTKNPIEELDDADLAALLSK